jgi:hypothetical protein
VRTCYLPSPTSDWGRWATLAGDVLDTLALHRSESSIRNSFDWWCL